MLEKRERCDGGSLLILLNLLKKSEEKDVVGSSVYLVLSFTFLF